MSHLVMQAPTRGEVLQIINQFSDEQFQVLSMYVTALQQLDQRVQSTTKKPTVMEVLSWSTPRRTAEEIDAALNAERDQWDNQQSPKMLVYLLMQTW